MSDTSERLTAGLEAPDFTLQDENGADVSLSGLRGEKVVVYFYPAANTPGCTTEACDFRDNINSLKGAGYRVLGVSKDAPDVLKGFAEAQGLNFPLLSDPQKVAGAAYEVIREPGVPFETKPLRYTYVIDPAGVIAYAEDANLLPLGSYGDHVVEVVAGLRAS